MGHLSYRGLSLALGITWGIGMLFMGWVGAAGWGAQFVDVMGSFYIGFKTTFIGGIIGAVWGFVDGFIGGILITFFYNIFCGHKKSEGE